MPKGKLFDTLFLLQNVLFVEAKGFQSRTEITSQICSFHITPSWAVKVGLPSTL